MKLHYFPSPAETNTLPTGRLRDYFLIGGLFRPGEIVAHYTDLDRMIVGGAMPSAGAPLALPTAKETGTDFFLERREIGILNLGAAGAVRIGGTRHELGTLDCLYIGLGEKEVFFENEGVEAANPQAPSSISSAPPPTPNTPRRSSAARTSRPIRSATPPGPIAAASTG